MRAAALALLLGAWLPSAAAAVEYRNAPGPVPLARPGQTPREAISACIARASTVHAVPDWALVVILRVEDGKLGRITRNASGAPPDVGPMQVNGQWITRGIAQRLGTDPQTAFLALRDDFCINLDMGAWILARCMKDAPGDLWAGIACYHSPTPHFRRRYLRSVLAQALWVHKLSGRAASAAPG